MTTIKTVVRRGDVNAAIVIRRTTPSDDDDAAGAEEIVNRWTIIDRPVVAAQPKPEPIEKPERG